MNKTSYLQELLDSQTVEHPEVGDWIIEYRAFDGWYAIPDYPRYVGDPGIFLGTNWKQSKKSLRNVFT